MIDRTNYETKKRELTERVSTVLDEHVNSMMEGIDAQNKEFLTSMWLNRKQRADRNGRLRDIMVYSVLDLFGVSDITSDHLEVIAAGELYNMASYYQNWHLDDKKNVKEGRDAKLCHIASHLYREKAHELIMNTEFPSDVRMQLLQEISESNKAIQVGQASELAGCRITDLQGKSEQDVIDQYIKRCYGMSGRFYGASFAMGAIMAQASKEHIDLCRDIGTLFGTGGQIINDVGDFCLVPSLVQLSEKDYQDQFADVMKGTLTLPTYELSKHVDIDAYLSRQLSDEEKEGILEKMVEVRAFDSSRKLSNQHMNSIKRRLLPQLPTHPARDELSYAIGLFFQCNKFYVNLRENHRYKWGEQK